MYFNNIYIHTTIHNTMTRVWTHADKKLLLNKLCYLETNDFMPESYKIFTKDNGYNMDIMMCYSDETCNQLDLLVSLINVCSTKIDEKIRQFKSVPIDKLKRKMNDEIDNNTKRRRGTQS